MGKEKRGRIETSPRKTETLTKDVQKSSCTAGRCVVIIAA
jgi:hypothetical protein